PPSGGVRQPCVPSHTLPVQSSRLAALQRTELCAQAPRSQASVVHASPSSQSLSVWHSGVGTASAAARASSRPNPDTSSGPASPMSAAASLSTFWIVAGGRKGVLPRSNAATAAECGAAAEVPKKRQGGGHSGEPPGVVVLKPG